MPTGIRDVVALRPRILLVGVNPSTRSGELGHHFASPGNPFWRLMFASGLLPLPLTAEEDHRLAEFGIALTNLCSRPTRSAADLAPTEIQRGRATLAKKIARLRPNVVAFVGLTVYQAYFALKKSGGAGPKAETIGKSRVFVVPNPSGLNASFPGFRHKLVWFEALRAFAGEGQRG